MPAKIEKLIETSFSVLSTWKIQKEMIREMILKNNKTDEFLTCTELASLLDDYSNIKFMQQLKRVAWERKDELGNMMQEENVYTEVEKLYRARCELAPKSYFVSIISLERLDILQIVEKVNMKQNDLEQRFEFFLTEYEQMNYPDSKASASMEQIKIDIEFIKKLKASNEAMVGQISGIVNACKQVTDNSQDQSSGASKTVFWKQKSQELTVVEGQREFSMLSTPKMR